MAVTADSVRLSGLGALIRRLISVIAAFGSSRADAHIHPQHRPMPFFSASGD